MGIKEDINRTVRLISEAHQADQFPNYIESIRFPYYKSLSHEAEITFDFPLTVLIGINGSGKSSALHALYGCPEGESTGTYWFTTPLDPIRQDRRKGEIPSIIYTYKIDDELAEVIKRRSGVAKGLDYWETSRPIKIYGMKSLEDGKRNPPVKKKVEFLDFRSELSAFDKFFHFGTFKNRKTITSKQDYIRRYSQYVRDAFNTNEPKKVYKKTNEPPFSFEDEGTKILSKILGKSYSKCSILFHNFYDAKGATVLFSNNFKRYSEAFAGRGEFAVAKLVYEILRAENGSLIILDEPEVSLHPQAQENLKLFLLEYCLRKKLQVVISTHSPKLIEFLPDKAIKLFYEEDDGKFNIRNKTTYYEAFHQIGERLSRGDKKTIVVEDGIAKALLENILSDLGRDYLLLFQIVHYPGGAEDIYKSSINYSQENEINKFIILDGDKRKPQYNPQTFTVEQSQDILFIEGKVREVTNSTVKKLGFRLDGNGREANPEQKLTVLKNYLSFNNNHLDYFPLNTPEEIIWDEDYANKLLSADGTEMPNYIVDYKKKFVKFSTLFNGESTSEVINANQKKFIRNFVSQKNEHYHQIVEIIDKFKNQTHADG